ncbi:MAG: hypothetical protein KDD89_06800 [Anaerolineales bacterium]|nr:hypothetical protein [Anaerolineales bacterium]
MTTVYTYSEARQKLATLLDEVVKDGQVLIQRQDGTLFVVQQQAEAGSPLAVPGVDLALTRAELVSFVQEGRQDWREAAVLHEVGDDYTTAVFNFTTYENQTDNHITLHCASCAQLRKHLSPTTGRYVNHATYQDALAYAQTAHLALEHCPFCQPPAGCEPD